MRIRIPLDLQQPEHVGGQQLSLGAIDNSTVDAAGGFRKGVHTEYPALLSVPPTKPRRII